MGRRAEGLPGAWKSVDPRTGACGDHGAGHAKRGAEGACGQGTARWDLRAHGGDSAAVCRVCTQMKLRWGPHKATPSTKDGALRTSQGEGPLWSVSCVSASCVSACCVPVSQPWSPTPGCRGHCGSCTWSGAWCLLLSGGVGGNCALGLCPLHSFPEGMCTVARTGTDAGWGLREMGPRVSCGALQGLSCRISE